MYILWNKETSFDVDYKFRNIFVRVIWDFQCQQLQIQV